MLTSSFRTTESQAGNQDERVKTNGHYVLKYMDPNDGVSEIILKQNRIPGTEGNAIFVGRKSDCCTDSERKRRVLYIKQLLFELFPLVDTQRDTTVFRAEVNPTSLFPAMLYPAAIADLLDAYIPDMMDEVVEGVK
jgi:hypothetical protein